MSGISDLDAADIEISATGGTTRFLKRGIEVPGLAWTTESANCHDDSDGRNIHVFITKYKDRTFQFSDPDLSRQSKIQQSVRGQFKKTVVS